MNADRLEKILYPVVRVRAKNSGGSGTVVWSGENTDGKYNTYILTNHHVVDGLIRVEEKFDPFLKRKQVVESLATADVEFFKYPEGSQLEGTLGMKADIVTYSKEHDLALLKLRSIAAVEFVAALPPLTRKDDIHLGTSIDAVGAALFHPPIMSHGIVNFMDEEIDDKLYWMSNASTIFGNSGGAVFLTETDEFIGIPSRGEVINIGWSVNVVPHMNWFIPFPRIYEWLREQYYNFIFGESSYDQCEVDRNLALDQQQRLADMNDLQRLDDKPKPLGRYYNT